MFQRCVALNFSKVMKLIYSNKHKNIQNYAFLDIVTQSFITTDRTFNLVILKFFMFKY